MSFKVYSSISNPTGIQVLGLLYSSANESTFTWDIGGYANLGSFAADTWNTFYMPLTSTNTTDRLQIIIKNTYHEQMITYLDDIQLFYNPDENNISDISHSLELLE